MISYKKPVYLHVRFESEFDTRKQSTWAGGDFLRRTSSSRLQMFFKIDAF